MLPKERLVELYEKLRETDVLSVYLDGEAHDPAERTAWSRDLDRRLKEERARVEAEAADQVEAFDSAAKRVLEQLEGFSAFLPGRGWVAFATAEALPYAESVAVPMPNLVRWERGLRVAPYVRALKQDRTVVAAVADSRKARVFTYRDGALDEQIDLLADTSVGDLSDVGSSKRGRAVEGQQRTGTHSGTRGQTATDAAQRLLEEGASRLQGAVADKLQALAGSDGFAVIGGTPEVVSALSQRMAHLEGRVLERPSLHFGMSDADVKAAIEEAASELSRGVQERLLDGVVDLARAGGKGCLGEEATDKALREHRVETLLISRALREQDPDRADHWVGGAFRQGAMVEELSGPGGDRLDAEGGGIAARLRYTVQ